MNDSTKSLEDVLQECLGGGCGYKVTWHFGSNSDRESVMGFNEMNSKVRSNHKGEVKVILNQAAGEVVFENISPAPAPAPAPTPIPAPEPVPNWIPAPETLACNEEDCDSGDCDGSCVDWDEPENFDGSSDT